MRHVGLAIKIAELLAYALALGMVAIMVYAAVNGGLK